MRLAHGKASALDLELLQAISRTLEDAENDPQVRALVLTGTDGIFCAGVDLKRILDGGDEYAQRYIPLLDEVFEQLFVFPHPVVCATNGHSIAGGCILTLACDYKLMATGRGRMGIPEMKVGVPFPCSAFEIVRFAVPKSQAQALYYLAETVLPEEALARGLVDELQAPEDLLARAQSVASELAAIPVESFQITKRMLRAPAVETMRANRSEYGRAILGRWAHQATYDHIREYLAQTLKK